MATRVVTPDQLAQVLTERLQRKLKALEPNNPRLKEVMLRIGFLIEGETKLNIRRAQLIDNGHLINSIGHFIRAAGDNTELVVGSFGIPYAAIHEFGFNSMVSVGSFSRKGADVRPFKRRGRGGSDVDVRGHSRSGGAVRAHNRQMSIKGHHYLGSAAEKVAGKVPRIIGQMFRSS